MPDPFIISLRKPVGPKGHEIAELRLREPTAGEVLAASRETGRGLALSLLSQVTGKAKGVIEALPGRACDQALVYLMGFIEPIFAEPDTVADEAGELLDEPADELTIDLPDTLQIGTTWVTQLVLREPTLGELIKADKYTGMQRTIALVALVSGVPRAVIELVPISAFAKAAAFVRDFTDAAPARGAAPLAA